MNETRSNMSEHLVENAHEPARLQVVLHEPATKVANAQLTDLCRQDFIGRTDVEWPDNAAQHDDLTIAVDLDFSNALDNQITVREHVGDARGHLRGQRTGAVGRAASFEIRLR